MQEIFSHAVGILTEEGNLRQLDEFRQAVYNYLYTSKNTQNLCLTVASADAIQIIHGSISAMQKCFHSSSAGWV